jgi:hypothetical protein
MVLSGGKKVSIKLWNFQMLLSYEKSGVKYEEKLERNKSHRAAL